MADKNIEIGYDIVNFYVQWTNNNTTVFTDGRKKVTPSVNTKFISSSMFPTTQSTYTINDETCGKIIITRKNSPTVTDCNITISAEVSNNPLNEKDTIVNINLILTKTITYSNGDIETSNIYSSTTKEWTNITETEHTFPISYEDDCGKATTTVTANRYKGGKIITGYSCTLTSTETSKTINWNTKSYSFKYVETQTPVYSDGTTGSPTTYRKYKVVSFSDFNTSTESRNVTSSVTCDDNTLTFTLTQNGKPEPTEEGCTFVIENIVYDKQVDWDVTSVTVTFDVIKTTTYSNGDVVEETITYEEDVEIGINDTKETKKKEYTIEYDDCDGDNITIEIEQGFKPYDKILDCSKSVVILSTKSINPATEKPETNYQFESSGGSKTLYAYFHPKYTDGTWGSWESCTIS